MPKKTRKNPRLGGARPGAGRPKKSPTKAIRIREDVAVELEILLSLEGADYVVDLLRSHTEPHFLRAADEVLAAPAPAPALNQDQQAAIKILNSWLNSDNRTATLSGAGGTGKTFTIGYWLMQLPDNENIIFLAPTHKAKNVLKRSLESSNFNSPEVYTIAQALGKQPIINSTGLEEFVAEDERDRLSNAKLVVIDESSMINQEDYQEIIDKAKKVLFMGDKNQLPPVGESEALAFANPPDCELKKVMRYSGHILNECTKLREGVANNFIHRIECDGKQIIRLKRQDALFKATELFKSKNFQDDSTFCRILAFRNKQVDSNNKFVKPRVFGRNDDYFEKLRLIASKPVQRKDGNGKWQIYCNNSEEMRVISAPEVVEVDKNLLAAMPKNCRELKSLCGVGNATKFKCLSESGLEFEAIILGKEANLKKLELIKLIQGLYKQKMSKNLKSALTFLYRWGDDLKDIFCSTIHKAQGSTYTHVFIELSDILRPSSQKKSWEPDDRPKLLYTAVSRASERVYLID